MSTSTPAAGGHLTRTLLRVAVGLVALLALLWVAGHAVAGRQVPAGTHVLGTDIGGLDEQAATRRLAAATAPAATAPIEVTVGGESAQVPPVEAGLALDAPATVRAAAGDSWNPVSIVRALAGRGGDLDPVLTADRTKLRAATTALAARMDRAPREGGVAFAAGRVVQTAPVTGLALDVAAAQRQLREAYLVQRTPVALRTTSTAPRTGAAEVARAVRELAGPAVAAPVDFVAGTHRVTLPAAAVLGSARLVPDRQGRLRLSVDPAALATVVPPRFPEVVTAPRDATFRISKGKPVVVPAVDGRRVDPTGLATGLATALAQPPGLRSVPVATAGAPAELTTAAAQQLHVTQRLSTFTQDFPYAPYRKQNIGRAARYIDGTLLLPGQTFSMNDTVKERTVANGYTIGTVIAEGRFREELGGGVSTITTAMWTAAFYAALQRVEQRAHSFYISRYRSGLEATVAWGSLDLKFRNDSPDGVWIQAKSGSDFVTITMWGTKRFDVDAVTGSRTDVRPPQTVYDPEPGCVVQGGVPGYDVTVTRVFKAGGKVVKREPLRTHYNVADQIYCRAAPEPSPSPPPSPSPSPSPAPSTVVTPPPPA